jgi:hypothetical protein
VQIKAFHAVSFLHDAKVFETPSVSEIIWKSGAIYLGVFAPLKLAPVNCITTFEGAVHGKGPQSSLFAHRGSGSIKNATELSVTLMNLAFLKTWTGILSDE